MVILRAMNELRTYLTRTDIRQDDFAATVGVTQATISKLVRGIARPSLDLAFAISNATNDAVPVSSWRRGGEQEANSNPQNESSNEQPENPDPA